MRPRTLATAILLIALPSVVLGATASEVVRRAQESERQVSYRGMKTATVSVGHHTVTAVVKIVHLRPSRTRAEYFSPSALAGTIIIQNEGQIWRYVPDDNIWEQVRGCSLIAPDVIRQEVAENYEIRLVGTDEVAGRAAYVLQAVPRHRGEYAHRLWVDKDCFVLVGTQVETPYGTVINSSRFTSLQINPQDISPSVFRVEGRIRNTSNRVPGVPFRVMRPSYLPKGYRQVGISLLTVNGVSFAHLTFSNGANTISLFQRKAEGHHSAAEFKRKAPSVFTWVEKGMQLTLIGQLDQAQIKKIAESIH